MHISTQWIGIIAMLATFSTVSAISIVVDGAFALKNALSFGCTEAFAFVCMLALTALAAISFRTAVVFTLRYVEAMRREL